MKCFHPISVYNKEFKQTCFVPCGKCPACKERSRNEWVMRMSLESEVNDISLFLTLTYSDEHLKLDENFDYIINYQDFSQFLKKLKRAYKDRFRIRYYGNVELGEKHGRPHAHFVLFVKYNLYENSSFEIIDDLCKTIAQFWNKGFVSLRRASFGELWYTAKYTAKELGECDKGTRQHRTFCSKHPCIGAEYILRNGRNLNSTRLIDRKRSLIDPRNMLMSKDHHYSSIPRTFKRMLRKQRGEDDKMNYREFSLFRQQQIIDELETLDNMYKHYIVNHCFIPFDEFFDLFHKNKREIEKHYYYKRSKINTDDN